MQLEYDELEDLWYQTLFKLNYLAGNFLHSLQLNVTHQTRRLTSLQFFDELLLLRNLMGESVDWVFDLEFNGQRRWPLAVSLNFEEIPFIRSEKVVQLLKIVPELRD